MVRFGRLMSCRWRRMQSRFRCSRRCRDRRRLNCHPRRRYCRFRRWTKSIRPDTAAGAVLPEAAATQARAVAAAAGECGVSENASRWIGRSQRAIAATEARHLGLIRPTSPYCSQPCRRHWRTSGQNHPADRRRTDRSPATVRRRRTDTAPEGRNVVLHFVSRFPRESVRDLISPVAPSVAVLRPRARFHLFQLRHRLHRIGELPIGARPPTDSRIPHPTKSSHRGPNNTQ